MAETTTCPNCSKRFAARPEAVGRRVKCSGCAQPFVVTLDPAPEEPPAIDDLAAAAAMTPEASWAPAAPVESRPARAPIRLNPKLLWGAGVGVALAAAALVAYCMWPAHVEPRKTSIAAAIEAQDKPIPSNMKRYVGDGLLDEPGRPQQTLPADKYPVEWVVHIFIKGAVKADGARPHRSGIASAFGSLATSGEVEPAWVNWAAEEKAVGASIGVGCDSHIRFPDNSQLITGPVHDINRLVTQLVKPSGDRQNDGTFNRQEYYMSRLTITPESVSVDMAQRTITIDLSKATFRLDAPGNAPADVQQAGEAAARPQPAQPDANAGQPRPAGDPDLSTPELALRALLVARATNDAATMKACTFNLDPEVIDTSCKVNETMREAYQAAFDRFGPQGPARPKRLDELAAEANRDADAYLASIRVNGNSASLTAPDRNGFDLQLIGGQWKVDGSFLGAPRLAEQRKLDIIGLRIGTGVWSLVKHQITEGKFPDWPTAEIAAKRRIAEALAASAEYAEAERALAQARGLPPPAPRLHRAADADLVPLREVLHTYLLAIETGDAGGLKSCLFNIEPEFIDVHCAVMASIREMNELGATKCASMPWAPARPKTVDALKATADQDYQVFAKLPILIAGDGAVLQVSGTKAINFKKIDGNWKVNGDVLFADPSPENKRRDLLADRIALKVRGPLRDALAAGKFKSWPAVEQALRIRCLKAMAADPEYQQADKALAQARSRQVPAVEQQAQQGPGGDLPATAGRTAQVGGGGGQAFTQASPDGRPLLGFRYAFGNWNNHQVLGQFDAVFQSSNAAPGDAANTKTILARSGYIVGGLIVDFDNVNSFAVRVIFVGYKDGHVNAKSTYTGDWIGIPLKVHQQQLAGNGEKVIGLFGRQGMNTDALGLLLAPDAGPTARPGAAAPAQ